jgi:hypothetical protein
MQIEKTGCSRRGFIAKAAAAALMAGTLISTDRSRADDNAPKVKPPAKAKPVARPGGGNDSFGINLHIEEFASDLAYKQASEARVLGVGWARGLQAGMNRVQPARGQFSFAHVDSDLATLKSLGFSILGSIGPSVAWATPLDDAQDSAPDRRSYFPPLRISEWSDHVEMVVKRYKRQIRYWSPWNEPDNFLYWYPPKDESQKVKANYLAERRQVFLDLQRATYAAAKKADPECVVLSGAFALAGDYDPDFAPWLIGNGLMEACDIIDFHAYGSIKAIIDGVANLQTWMHAGTGVEKPLWITQAGLQFRKQDIGTGPVSHDDILNYAPKALATALALGVKKLFWYEGYTEQAGDAVGSTVSVDRSGYSVIVTDGPTPAMWSLATTVRLLQGARYLGPAAMEVLSGSATGYTFSTRDGELSMLWADAPGRLENRSAASEVVLHWQNRKLPLILSERPTILLGPQKTAAAPHAAKAKPRKSA